MGLWTRRAGMRCERTRTCRDTHTFAFLSELLLAASLVQAFSFVASQRYLYSTTMPCISSSQLVSSNRLVVT